MDYKRGAVAGLLAATAATAFGAMGRLALGTPFLPEALGVGFYEALPGWLVTYLILLLRGLAKPLALALGLLLYLALGAFLGIGFQVLHRRLPFDAPWAKGLAYASIPWVLTTLLMGPSPGWRSWTLGSYRISISAQALDHAALIATWALYGIILGLAYREVP